MLSTLGKALKKNIQSIEKTRICLVDFPNIIMNLGTVSTIIDISEKIVTHP